MTGREAAQAPRAQGTARRWLGVRGTPGRLALLVFRLPVFLYRRGWGGLLGRTFLLVTHVGRRTGTARETVAMVLADDRTTGEVVICSAWGTDVDWIRNLRAQPARRIRVGRQEFVPEQRFLTDDEALTVAGDFRRRHPWRFRVIAAVLGWGDCRTDAGLRELVRTRPFVSFRPVS